MHAMRMAITKLMLAGATISRAIITTMGVNVQGWIMEVLRTVLSVLFRCGSTNAIHQRVGGYQCLFLIFTSALERSSKGMWPSDQIS
jgi:hypothetical protein